MTTTAAGSKYTPDFGGTSSACPFVSGVVGLVLSAAPTLTAQQVRDILASTATKIDRVFGQWDDAGHSNFRGAGLVNASAAVQLASGGCQAPEQCVAPSDDCGDKCGTRGQCEACRTHADCAPGHVCQALPSLGALVCVAEKGDADCPDGTAEVGGYCLPSPATCKLCGQAEACNGRDDDCNGKVDDGDVCQNGPLCFIDGPGCEAALVCVGRRCSPACQQDGDCSGGATCEKLTGQYGTIESEKACMAQHQYGGPGGCENRCEVRVSTLPDDKLAELVACMEDGAADCDVIDTCRELFPKQ
ncbi:MAG: S8 family serine peptidase [Deltaproteobacteria bacterium]|nr:S8 family serine peptidase [Deltaproteobacteria bacterium]